MAANCFLYNWCHLILFTGFEPKGIISELNLKNLILFSIEKLIALSSDSKLYSIISFKRDSVTELSLMV